MLLAMAQDVRVILIKLADRLHNMRTLDAMAPTHRRRIARETIEIYAPIANRLGLNALYLELQDLAFKHLHPMRYRDARRRDQGRARQPARGDEPAARRDPRRLRQGEHRRPRSAAARRRSSRSTRRCARSTTRSRRCSTSTACACWSPTRTTCYARARRAAQPLQADPGQVQGLHRDPEGERLPVAAHDAVRPVRHAAGSADPHPRHAPDRRGRRRRALALQVGRRRSTSPRRSARRTAGCRACSRSSRNPATRRSSWRTSRSTSSPTRSTCSRPKGQDHGAAARRDRGRLRVRGAHRHRPPLRRRADQLRAAAAAHRVEERRPRRDPDLADRATQSVVALSSSAPARRARASAIS